MNLFELIAALELLICDGADPRLVVHVMKPVDKYDGGEMPFPVGSVYVDDGKVIIQS